MLDGEHEQDQRADDGQHQVEFHRLPGDAKRADDELKELSRNGVDVAEPVPDPSQCVDWPIDVELAPEDTLVVHLYGAKFEQLPGAVDGVRPEKGKGRDECCGREWGLHEEPPAESAVVSGTLA